MSTFEKPEGISWDPASVGLPPMPTIAPGEDSMSMTIAAALPALAAPLAASVETLQAKETMFSGKVVEAQSSYQNADDSGGQSVGQLGSMLGQMSQMGQQAAGAAGGGGGGTGMFGQLMQQAMQAAQGAKGGESSQGGGGGESAAGTSPAGAPAPAQQGATQPGQGSAGAPQPQQRDEATTKPEPPPAHDDRDKQPETHEQRPPVEAAGPGDRLHSAGPAPVAPHPRHGGEDLARRM